jgi:serine/threonine protein kinase
LESTIGNTITDYLLSEPDNTLDNIAPETKLKPYFSTDPSNGDCYSMDAYIPLEMLGKGGFSKVYLVRKASTGKIYAMKVISKKFASKWKG